MLLQTQLLWFRHQNCSQKVLFAVNVIFFLLAFVAFCVAAFTPGPKAMEVLSAATLEAAGGVAPLAFSLIGSMALFLGLMKVAEAGGLLTMTARLLSPLLRRLFPEVPCGHSAMGAMTMNVAANMLGLGNAATPFGIRAMEQLEAINPHKGTASNAQVLFLALNTASVTLLPTSVIALRVAAGAKDPAAVVAPTLAATLIAAVVAVIAARTLARFSPLPPVVASTALVQEDAKEEKVETAALLTPYPWVISLPVLALFLGVIPLMVVYGRVLGPWIIPSLIVGLLGFGLARRVPIYEVFVEGAKEGFTIAIRIIPYLVAILVTVGMFRASGAMDMLLTPLGNVTSGLGLPPEALAMAGMRTLSGSASFGLLDSFMKVPSIGPDSYTGLLLGTIYGSSETTFYVIAVYFGAIQTRRIRHALAAGLIADVAGLIAAVAVCRLLF